MAGNLRLGANTQATARMLVMAAVVGAALTAAWASAADKLFGWGLFDRVHGPWAAFAVLGGGVAPILASLIVWLRQPRGARITWDEWGVTEWDGDGVRAAIAWAKLRTQFGLTSARGNLPHVNPLANAVAGAVLAQGSLPSTGSGPSIGGHLVLSDEDGRRIDVTQGVQSATLNRRLSTAADLGPLANAEQVRAAPAGHAPALPSSETLLVLGYAFGLLAYLAGFLSLLALGFQQPALAWVGAVAAAVLLLLRSLPWWARARALRQADRGATEVALDGGTPELLQVRDAAGNRRAVDLVVLKHPDAALATRTGAAWLLEKDGAVVSLETAGQRAARHARARATRIEAALRTLLAGLVLLPAGPAAYEGLRELARGVEGVDPVFLQSGYERVGYSLDVPSALAVVGDLDGPKLIDLRTGAARGPLGPAGCRRAQASTSPDGRWALLSCDEHQGPFTIYSLEGEPRAVGKIEAELLDPRIAFDGPATVIFGDSIGRVSAWELPSGRKLREMPYLGGYYLRGLASSPTTHELVLGGWDSSGPARAYRWSGDGPATALEATHDTLGAVAISADGRYFAVAVKGGVELFDAAGGKRGAIEIDGVGTDALAFSPDGRTLAIAATASRFDEKNVVTFAEVPALRRTGQRPIRWRRDTFDFVDESAKAMGYADDGRLVVLTRGGSVLRLAPP